MDDDKLDHLLPIIAPLHLRNDVNPVPSYSSPVTLLTAVLSLQVKVIDDYGDILILVGFHNKFYLKMSQVIPKIWLKYYNQLSMQGDVSSWWMVER